MARRVYTIYLIPEWAERGRERGKMVLNAHSLLPAISVSSATLPWCLSSSGETHASCLTVSQLVICFVLSAQTGISGNVITDLYDSLRLKWQYTSTDISMHQMHCNELQVSSVADAVNLGYRPVLWCYTHHFLCEPPEGLWQFSLICICVVTWRQRIKLKARHHRIIHFTFQSRFGKALCRQTVNMEQN